MTHIPSLLHHSKRKTHTIRQVQVSRWHMTHFHLRQRRLIFVFLG